MGVKIGNLDVIFKVGSADCKVYLGDTLLYPTTPPTPSRLPSGYTEVEYVENTSSAYIDTGFKPNQDTRIVATMQTVTSTQYGRLFGCGGYDQGNAMQFDYEDGYDGTLHISWGHIAGWTTYSSCVGDYNKHTYDWDKNVFYRDKGENNEFSASTTYTNFQCVLNLSIFMALQTSGPDTGGAIWKGKMFDFKVYDNGTLIRDLVPCKRDSDNMAGCYDLVNDVFYYPPNYSTYQLTPGPEVTPSIKNYLRFVSKGSGTFTFFANGADSGNTVSYSLDSGQTWTQLANGDSTPTVSSGDTVFWKGSNHTIIENKGIGTFSSTANFDAEGNIMSLHYGDNFEGEVSLAGKDRAFMGLFSGCTTLINADKLELPATTLSTQCYCNMFNRASGLVTLPSLSAATTLAEGCYQNMFYQYPTNYSLSMTESYLLPAATLVKDCYRQMFYGRYNLKKITCLATSGINTNNSTDNWLSNVDNASSSIFTRANSSVSWPSGNSGVPSRWSIVDYA